MNQKTSFIAAFVLTAFAACSNPSTVPDANTIGSNGGTVISSDTNASVQIPAGALSGDTKISVTPITETLTGPAGSSVLPGSAFEIGGGTPSAPVTLTIRYDAIKLAALSGRLKTTAVLETALKIFKLEGTTWSPLVSTVDTSKKSVSAASSSFGKFALLDGTYGGGLGESAVVTDKLEGWINGTTGTLKTLANEYKSPATTLSEAAIGVDGSFSLALPSRTAITPFLQKESDLPLAFGTPNCKTSTIVSSSVKTAFFQLNVFTASGATLGNAGFGSRQTILAVQYLFADRDATVKGDCTRDASQGGPGKFSYDLILVAGWNRVVSEGIQNGSSIEIKLLSGPIPSDSKWFFGVYEIEGKTKTIVGTVKTWPTGKTAKFSANFGQVNSDGSFSIQFPDLSANTSPLPSIQNSGPGSLISAGCTTLTVSTTEAKGMMVPGLPVFNTAGIQAGQLTFSNYGPETTSFFVGMKVHQYFFADRPVTVTGECLFDPTKNSGLAKLTYDLRLVAGWNTITFVGTAFPTGTQEFALRTLPTTLDMNWYFRGNAASLDNLAPQSPR
jgi:hypothetical protein